MGGTTPTVGPQGTKGMAMHQADRVSRLYTVLACHSPPRAVRIPRAFSAMAIARNVFAPEPWISRTIGRTFAAKASAAATFAALPNAPASVRLVRLPSYARAYAPGS